MKHFNSNLRTQKIEHDKISSFIEHINFKVNSVGIWSSENDTKADYTIEDIELIFYSKGGSYTTVRGKEYKCIPMDLLVLDSNGYFTSKNIGYDEYEYHFIHFSIEPSIYEKVFIDLLYSSSPVIRVKEANNIEILFRRIVKEYKEAKIGYASKINAYIKILCVEILRSTERKELIPEYRQSNLDAKTAIVNEVIDYIKENPETKLKVKDISSHFGVSQNYLFKSFIEVMSIGPQEYIINNKVEMAKDLINSNRYLMGDIALELGFSSDVHFSRVFKTKVGISPKQYQKKQKEKV